MAKTRTVAGAGTLATAALVLLFGNQPFTEWVDRHISDTGGAWDWFLRTLTWPRWWIGPWDGSSAEVRQLLANDIRAILLVAFVALILSLVAKSVAGGGAGFFLGWSALVFGSALAAFLTAFIISNPSLVNAFQVAANGSAYGLFVGWIVGAVTAGAKGAGS
ncbi:MAG TPA: hypothetical protein VFC19_22725 [Candidatus Limnocylindrales bacterium]|nr:hypothetical protein [Candidatus Limnocylindrales bacterium]